MMEEKRTTTIEDVRVAECQQCHSTDFKMGITAGGRFIIRCSGCGGSTWLDLFMAQSRKMCGS